MCVGSVRCGSVIVMVCWLSLLGLLLPIVWVELTMCCRRVRQGRLVDVRGVSILLCDCL